MKNVLLFVPFAVLVGLGCQPKSEFDITPAQVKNHRPGGGLAGGPIDPAHLPPGAVKQEKTFHKGDRLPDGTISPGERKMVSIRVGKP